MTELIIKLFYPNPPHGHEIRLFEIHRNVPFDVLLHQIAIRLPPPDTKQPNAEGQTTAKEGGEQEYLDPHQAMKSGLYICDFTNDWITVTCQDEWALFLKSCMPNESEDEQKCFILNVQLRSSFVDGIQASPALTVGASPCKPTTLRRISNAIKNLFTVSSTTKPKPKQEATQKEEAPTEDAPMNDQLALSILFGEGDPEEPEDEAAFEIINKREESEEEEEIGELDVKQEESEEEDESDEEDSDSDVKRDESEDESEEEEEEEDESEDDESEEPAEEQAPTAPEVEVPPEYQKAWDLLVQMGFTDHEKMLHLLVKNKGKNVVRIIDQLLHE